MRLAYRQATIGVVIITTIVNNYHQCFITITFFFLVPIRQTTISVIIIIDF